MKPEKRLYWNQDWEFTKRWNQGTEKLELAGEEGCLVEFPHSNAELPYHYFDESEYSFISGYRKKFTADLAWEGKEVLMTIEAAAHVIEVFLNGEKLGRHEGGYTAYTLSLTEGLRLGQENELILQVDSREELNIPPFGNVIDYMTYGGVYRNVYLEIKEKIWIADVYARATPMEQETEGLYRGRVESTITLGNGEIGDIPEGYTIRQKLTDGLNGETTQKVAARENELELMASGIRLWAVETPCLYRLRTTLYCSDILMDERETVIGFRTAEFKADGFYLNGIKIKIRGLNRHQSYPYVGYAMPEGMQAEDVLILKRELKVNAVRTSHYPQSHAFLDACDRLGLLVFTEIPGWQHIGDEAWKEVALRQTEEMVLQYRNHPSIILWGVRINESQDDDEFYGRTNAIAHRLDPTRPTGGVRFIKKSNLLEDVYTYNDFVHTGKNQGADPKKEVTSDVSKAYLISEYNGHMFPTKPFDDEAHRTEHALRHARVMDAYYGEEDIAGGFGWCMFDYNTHKDFGSGDAICYHGVMDMFRNPKQAAFIYASQAEEEPILEISSAMNIGEYPGGAIGAVYAYTNADAVRVYKNDKFVKEFYPDRKEFPHLPHPPIRMDDFVGELMEKEEGYSKKNAEAIKEVLFAVAKYGQNSLPLSYKLKMLKLMIFQGMTFEDGMRLFYQYIGNWGDTVTTYRFEAVKDGQTVKSMIKEPVTKKVLQAIPGSRYLHNGNTYEAVSVRLRMTDQNGNLLPYYQEPLKLSVQGPVRLIGPDIISLKGGMGGTYLRTTGESGEAVLFIEGNDIESIKIPFTVE